ncbi:hypothetical protein LCGC14_0630640 [marine sediment metagenome]|uniref:site-specific DNA-methyltransferase (adenine-specific) n=1 Tax=marine sediment metagenome TaxID=412755 RepID=A0A0F9RLH0_9ZZZZ
MTKPLLKWAGGKAWAVPVLSSRISTLLDKTGGRYIEPFVGGGAMALAVARPQMFLSDACDDLMNLYRVVRDVPCERLRTMLDMLGNCITKDYYCWIREQDPTCSIERAARFIYLNKTGFNGLHRENKSGGFNVPFGDPNRRDAGLFPNLEHLQEVATVLQGTTLVALDFVEPIHAAKCGDLLYIDPPYHGGYVNYVASGFSDDDQTRLAEELFLAHERGVAVIAHNANTELIQYLYSEWAHLELTGEKRAINSDPAGRGDAPCVIITTTL